MRLDASRSSEGSFTPTKSGNGGALRTVVPNGEVNQYGKWGGNTAAEGCVAIVAAVFDAAFGIAIPRYGVRLVRLHQGSS